jgi:hypothetical protein
MNLGQVYSVRRKEKICFEGSIEELRAWLLDQRISTDDEIKRHGLVVLEGEKLWSLVKDRDELGFNPVNERIRLKAVRLSLIWLSAITVLSLIAAVCIFYLNIVTPALEVQRISAHLDAENAVRVRQLDERLQALLKKAQVDIDHAQSRIEELSKGIPKLSGEPWKDADKATKGEFASSLNDVRAETKTVLDRYEARISAIEKVQQANKTTSSRISDSPKSVNPKTVLDCLSVRWSDAASPGYMYINVHNTTANTLTLTITRTYGTNKLPYKVNVPAGHVYKSGVRDFMTDSSGGIRAFTEGDVVSISLRDSLFFNTLQDVSLDVK